MFATDLEKWPIFCFLDTKFLRQIHMAVVFGNSGNEALIVTKDRSVFGLGSNKSGCLGIGDMYNTIHPKKVEALSGNDIKTFAFGLGPHVLALTKEGKVYSWGHNNYCELGHRNIDKAFPCLITKTIKGTCIVDIACGSYHSLALTENGEVYAWGKNTSGQAGGDDTTQSIPTKIDGNLAGKKIICISCGSSSSMVVTDNGLVYAWGNKNSTQSRLCYDSDDYCYGKWGPSLVTGLTGVVIDKVVCGYSHTLALSRTRVVYAWGANAYGQLGLGTKTSDSAPQIVKVSAKKVILDIAASHTDHISVAMTEGNEIFIWGQCSGRSIVVPMPTTLKYMHHAFACYAMSRTTYKPLIIYNGENSMSLIDCLKEAFNDQAMSDLVIKVEDKPIYVHQAVLKIRSEYFRRTLPETEDDKSVIRQEQFSYDVYKAFLKYLYTDEIVLSMDNMLELWALANLYSESVLIDRCINAITRGITVENVAILYSTSIQHRAARLQKACLAFAIDHLSAVVQTECFCKLDSDIMKTFIVESAKEGAFVN